MGLGIFLGTCDGRGGLFLRLWFHTANQVERSELGQARSNLNHHDASDRNQISAQNLGLGYFVWVLNAGDVGRIQVGDPGTVIIIIFF